MILQRLFRFTAAGLLILWVACAVGCGGSSEEEQQSIQNMEDLAGAVYEYYNFELQGSGKGKYPETLDDEGYQEDVGGPEVFQQLMINPLTGANPGYEYVKPPDDTPPDADVIILYQMRDGYRDVTLPGFTLNGIVRLP